MKKREDLLIWKILLKFEKIGIIVTGIGVTGIVAGACILRFFNINFAGFEELLVVVAFWLYMLGCAYGSFEQSQISANIIEVMMKAGLPKDLFALARLVFTTVLCGIMCYWAFTFFALSIVAGTQSPVFRFPMAIGYVSMVIGLGLSTVYNICYTYDAIVAILRRKKGVVEEVAQ
jgi:TRAP-type C4-dicarboxylate transport system permease small subunit